MCVNLNELTEKQSQIFEYIKKFILENHYPPTVREIAKGVELKSSSTVHSHLTQLKQKGYIIWRQENPRTIVIV